MVSSAVSAEQREILASLDAAARADDRAAWMQGADRFIASLTEEELAAVEATLSALTMAQMSTAEREEAQH